MAQPKADGDTLSNIPCTVFIKVPFPRGSFEDPPDSHWDVTKDGELWRILSSTSKGAEIDWEHLAQTFDVTLHFLLQQAAWLYERQLSQVREQLRRVGKPAGSASPAPSSTAGTPGGFGMRRGNSSSGARVPSGLSVRPRQSSDLRNEGSAPSTPVQSRVPYSRTTSKETVTQTRTIAGRDPLSKPSARAAEGLRDAPRAAEPFSPASHHSSSSSSSSSSSDSPAVTQSRAFARRPPFASARRPQAAALNVLSSADEDDHEDDNDDDDGPAFLPPSRDGSSAAGGRPTTGAMAAHRAASTSSLSSPAPSSSSSHHASAAGAAATSPRSRLHPARGGAGPARPVTAALSPRQRRIAQEAGSEGTGTPSMGSSFSDLDDASLTQSALEEALAREMKAGKGSLGVVSRMGGLWKGQGSGPSGRGKGKET